MTFKEEQAKAEQGYAWAQYQVGLHYYHGVDVPQNYVEAVKWFRKAADQDNHRAQGALVVMYRDGLGVTRDYAEAEMWFHRAASIREAVFQTESMRDEESHVEVREEHFSTRQKSPSPHPKNGR
jgi:hypothetical protein